MSWLKHNNQGSHQSISEYVFFYIMSLCGKHNNEKMLNWMNGVHWFYIVSICRRIKNCSFFQIPTELLACFKPGSAFIKWDHLNPWIKDKLGKALLSTIWPLQLPNFGNFGQAFPHDTKFGNCRCETVDRRVIFIRSLIHGSSWSGLIKAEPACRCIDVFRNEIEFFTEVSPLAFINIFLSLSNTTYISNI